MGQRRCRFAHRDQHPVQSVAVLGGFIRLLFAFQVYFNHMFVPT